MIHRKVQQAHGLLKTARYMARFAWSLCAQPLWLEATGRLDDQALKRLVKQMARDAFEIFELEVELRHQERLDPEAAYIYIANHRSWLDQPAVILAAPQLLRFLGKADYFKTPVLGTTLRLFGCLPVSRDKPGALIEVLSQALAQGKSFVLYPEGTRSPSEDFLPFRSGAFVLSAQTGASIAPLYIYGAHEALPRARPFWEVKPGKIIVEVGEPFVVPASFLDAPDVAPYQEAFIKTWEALKGAT